MLLLSCLSVLSLWYSALPWRWALPASLAALALGGFQWWRERQRPARRIVLGPGGAAAIEGEPVAGLRVQWVGPLACVSWRGADDRRRRLVFWPDTLAPAQRRELRLAASNANISRRRQAMAP